MALDQEITIENGKKAIIIELFKKKVLSGNWGGLVMGKREKRTGGEKADRKRGPLIAARNVNRVPFP